MQVLCNNSVESTMMWTSSILLIITCTTAVAVSPAQSTITFTIIPSDSTSSIESTATESSLTLQQLSNGLHNQSSYYFYKNITIVFAPGRHYLVGGVEFNKVANVIIRGQIANESKPEIICKKKSCFSFTNTSSILIKNVIFTECYNEDSDGGAIFISEAKTVNITRCLFLSNLVRRRGGAMRLQQIETAHILQCQFINNSAISSEPSFYKSYELRKCTASSGAISATWISFFEMIETLFEFNIATCHAGAVSVIHSITRVVNCTFSQNRLSAVRHVRADPGGAALLMDSGSAQILDSTFQENCVRPGANISYYQENNNLSVAGSSAFIESDILNGIFLSLNYQAIGNKKAYYGGAILARNSNVSSRSCMFSNNSAKSYSSGAITAFHSIVSSTECTFLSNSAGSHSGGAISAYHFSNVSSTDCVFSDNRANSRKAGGAISALKSVTTSTGCLFSNNRVESGCGGAISAWKSTVSSTDCVFSNNKALSSSESSSGGAIAAYKSAVYSTYCIFSSNSAETDGGGALSAMYGQLSSTGCVFTDNIAYFGSGGGAISTFFSEIFCINCTFSNNRDYSGGGIIFAVVGTFNSYNSSYMSNSEHPNGGALVLAGSTININGDNFHDFKSISTNNQTIENDQVYTIRLTNVHGTCRNLIFRNNIGSMFLFHSTLSFSGSSIFTGNTGLTGGGLTLIQSTASFEESFIAGNNATQYGGGILLSQSNLEIYTSLFTVEGNTATDGGGGIYAYLSTIVINSSDKMLFSSNSATQGGAILAIASTISIFNGTVLFTNNEAMTQGGAIALSEGAKIYIQKTVIAACDQSYININLTFSKNSANFGGALYVDDSTNSGFLCKQSSHNVVPMITVGECFIQTLRLYYTQSISDYWFYINIFFSSNIANKLGNDIYGGLLDRCQINAFAEIHNLKIPKQTSGIDYLKAIALFQDKIGNNNLPRPYNYSQVVNSVTKKYLKPLISSDPVQLCFCVNNTPNCTYQFSHILVKRGEVFSITAVTVDQVENPVNGTVLSHVLSSGTRLKTGQSQQLTPGTCTDVTFNVYSTALNATLELYPEGPCGSTGISSRKISIVFAECDCPNGLQKVPLDDECKCECKDSLRAYISKCQLENNTITVVRTSKKYWIQYAYTNNHNVSGFLLQTCPYDYCVAEPINLSMSLPLNVNKQCAHNRSGIMCGECEEGLSLVFGSSRCVQCNNNYLALLIAFAFAGIALVAFILILNLTVAVGTIHGLILYANIVAANSTSFLPAKTALRLFVSWINLDLGIDVCFYNGMNTYAKVLFQLVFPAYIILLSLLIIILSSFSDWFAKLIGFKNPVATLCTLFFLSYSKLLRTIIASLQFTHLTYPDGSINVLWLYNPSISYFTLNRIPFFVIAIIIIALGTVYTILLFFGQWIRKMRGGIRVVRCLQSNKYNAFIDAHHAPFATKYRFWVGILLLTRLIHHVLSAVLEDSTHLLIVSILMCALIILKQFLSEVYQNWTVNFVETSFFINLLLFSVSTYFVGATNGDQIALANTSVAITLITFIGIVLYHAHTYFFKNLPIYLKLAVEVKKYLQLIKQKVTNTNPVLSTDIVEVASNTESDVLLSTNTLREPALDIIAPVSAEDYAPHSASDCNNEIPKPKPKPKPPTRTVVII